MMTTSSGSEGPDRATVVRAQRGDPRALDDLLRQLMPYLGRICGAIALEHGDDALQETMIAVMRHIGSLRDPGAVRGWARRIALRESLRQVRPGPATPTAPELLEATAAPGTGETAVDVRDALAALSPDQRAVLVLQHFEGLSEAEIARVLDLPVGTVKSRLSRAREAFRGGWTR
jgi:RNA polymerase sigma factor (sigma-70 family)